MITAIAMAAMEICAGSSAYWGCVDWMQNCALGHLVAAEPFVFDHVMENCAENLPAWATKGM